MAETNLFSAMWDLVSYTQTDLDARLQVACDDSDTESIEYLADVQASVDTVRTALERNPQFFDYGVKTNG